MKANTKAYFLCVAPTSSNNKNKYICTHSVKGLGISYDRKSLLTNAVQIRRLNLLPTPLGLFINDVNQKIDTVTKIGVPRPSLSCSNGTSSCQIHFINWTSLKNDPAHEFPYPPTFTGYFEANKIFRI